MKVYADNAATTALCKAALDTMIHCLENEYGNASSAHSAGRLANKRLEAARSGIAASLNASSKEIYFTSGGTEADNWALTAAAELGAREHKRHIISSAFEHHAVLHTLDKLRRNGFEITLLPVHEDGIVRPCELEAAIRGDTALVTVMYANNELGTVQPISELGRICRERGVLFHTDAVQAVGHVPVDVKNIDMLSLSAHKFHGPKGVGALYCRKGIKLMPFIEGGAQEGGMRAGTVNVPSIAAMAAALEEACRSMPESIVRVSAMRERLIEAFCAMEGVRLNGSREKRLPGIANFSFEGVEGEGLLALLDIAGICASSGSACNAGSEEPSHVLTAIGLSKYANSSLRLSLGEFNTDEEIDYIIDTLPPIVERLRRMYSR